MWLVLVIGWCINNREQQFDIDKQYEIVDEQEQLIEALKWVHEMWLIIIFANSICLVMCVLMLLLLLLLLLLCCREEVAILRRQLETLRPDTGASKGAAGAASPKPSVASGSDGDDSHWAGKIEEMSAEHLRVSEWMSEWLI
jgi:hypothetical protein